MPDKRKRHVLPAPVVPAAAPFLGAGALRLRREAVIEIESRIAFQRVQVRAMREDPRGAHQMAGPIGASFGLARVQQEQVLARFRRRVIAIRGMEVPDVAGRIFVWHVTHRPANAGNVSASRTRRVPVGRSGKTA
jgi:hypothetical protein